MNKVKKISNFINGSFCETNDHIECVNPSTGKVAWLVPKSTKQEVQLAIESAKQAFDRWSTLAVEERCKYLFKIADSIERQSDLLAKLESEDQGKPLWLSSTMDIPRAAQNFRHFATTIQSDCETAHVDSERGVVNYSVHEPVGVVGIITPWNLPLYLLTFKLAPALAYGNTVVAKPSEITPVTAYFLCKILVDVGLPPGVVNIVFGFGKTVGEELTTHPDVKLISFTGSTATGIRVMENAAKGVKKVSAELGGKNAAIVFKDIILEDVISKLIKASFLNQGEICLCASRIYVEEDIYSDFVNMFAKETKSLKVGDPFEEDTFLGPLVSGDHLEKVQAYVNIAKSDGGKVICGGDRTDLSLKPENQNGFFFPPTVIVDVKEESRCMKEEIFGPVVAISPFKQMAEVIRRANDVAYGLSATVWTNDVNLLHTVVHRLKVGTVWGNCWLVRNLHMPFGGMKSSGIGREGTFDSREFYTEKKTVCLQLLPPSILNGKATDHQG